jgi:hypothetical protein
MAQAEAAKATRPFRRPGLLDDTLATQAVLDMCPEEIMRDSNDPERLRLGDVIAEAVLEKLKQRDREADAKE